MEAINNDYGVRNMLFNNVTLPSSEEDFHAEAESYVAYKIGIDF